MLVAVVWLFFLSAKTDSLVGPAYNAVGSVTFSGNNVCAWRCSQRQCFFLGWGSVVISAPQTVSSTHEQLTFAAIA